jgi:hypothetical protein
MKPLFWLAIFVIPLGMIIAAVPQNTTHPYKLSAAELLRPMHGLNLSLLKPWLT